jgi:signal transduction histidine kinase
MLNSGLGMKTLMERANILKSKLNVKSRPNQGTEIELIIPT